ncbi:MAG: hypothetical protein LBT51_00840 [Fusobacteriaceae bacterium]|nr:hypothetical protein [Fusobacteriaceae bacterium]
MKSSELNKLLIERFPNLNEEYIEEIEWQEGNDTGAHVVFGDVFTPNLINSMKNNKYEEIICYFEFIEMVLDLEDPYADEVVLFSVLESIEYLVSGNKKLFSLLGDKSKKNMVLIQEYLHKHDIGI